MAQAKPDFCKELFNIAFAVFWQVLTTEQRERVSLFLKRFINVFIHDKPHLSDKSNSEIEGGVGESSGGDESEDSNTDSLAAMQTILKLAEYLEHS